ncbi:4a-hydroxytetrahydrobiopterin dehydratase [Brevibacterium linens]|uniref:Putative pterin-4-alpha-carbinolamine dehydratase n=1 Tax=Brevibacterium linens TaxID=1703 RepID=A0A0B9A0W5_BRELN|nr:4a-hydroxytetrahydrobiopterin dehydratase [Brevibacterium linens]AMT94958.1 pterin-4-alpha-carbinolamine dehydratase [Brevibacterium linens]KHS52241.1 transcriptional coactivator/pterin dehydratase [Brevibacterium linens]
MTAFTGQELTDTLNDKGLTDWQARNDAIGTRLLTGDFATGLDLVNKIGAAAEEAGHHPDITLTFPHVDIQLTSHDTGAVTERDLDLAGTISKLAASAGVKADPNAD